MAIKAIFKSGLWVITAVVAGELQEFAGKRLPQAVALYRAEQERAGVFVA